MCGESTTPTYTYTGCDAIFTEHTVPTSTPKNLTEVLSTLENLEFALGRMADEAEFEAESSGNYEHLSAIVYTGHRIEMALENLENYMDMVHYTPKA